MIKLLYTKSKNSTRSMKLCSNAHRCAAQYLQSVCNYKDTEKLTVSRIKITPDYKTYTVFLYSNSKEKIQDKDLKIMSLEMKNFFMKNLFTKKINDLIIKLETTKTNNIIEVEKALEYIKENGSRRSN